MSVVQRHLTAIASLSVLLLLGACGSGDREVALAGAAVVGDSSSTTDGAAPPPPAALSAKPGPGSTDPARTVPATPDEGTTSAEDRAHEAALDNIETAVAREDICGVYAGLARIELSPTSSRLLAQLTRIRDVMERSSAFVAASLEADWGTVTDGTADMAASLSAHAASGTKSSAPEFDAERYGAASHRVGAWMDQNCA